MEEALLEQSEAAEETMTVDDLAARLGQHRATIYRAIKLLAPEVTRRMMVRSSDGKTHIRVRLFLKHWKSDPVGKRAQVAVRLSKELDRLVSGLAEDVRRLSLESAAVDTVGLLDLYEDRRSKQCSEEIEYAIKRARTFCATGVALRDFLSEDSPLFQTLLERIQQRDRIEFHGLILDPTTPEAHLRAIIESGPVRFEESQLAVDFRKVRRGYDILLKAAKASRSRVSIQVKATRANHPGFLFAAAFSEKSEGFLLWQNYVLAPRQTPSVTQLPVLKFSIESKMYELQRRMFMCLFGEDDVELSDEERRLFAEVAKSRPLEDWDLLSLDPNPETCEQLNLLSSEKSKERQR